MPELKVCFFLGFTVTLCCNPYYCHGLPELKNTGETQPFQKVAQTVFQMKGVSTFVNPLKRSERSSPLVPLTSGLEKGSADSQDITDTDVKKESSAPHRYQVASLDFNHVSSPLIISLWILTAGFAKIGECFQFDPLLISMQLSKNINNARILMRTS